MELLLWADLDNWPINYILKPFNLWADSEVSWLHDEMRAEILLEGMTGYNKTTNVGMADAGILNISWFSINL